MEHVNKIDKSINGKLTMVILETLSMYQEYRNENNELVFKIERNISNGYIERLVSKLKEFLILRTWFDEKVDTDKHALYILQLAKRVSNITHTKTQNGFNIHFQFDFFTNEEMLLNLYNTIQLYGVNNDVDDASKDKLINRYQIEILMINDIFHILVSTMESIY